MSYQQQHNDPYYSNNHYQQQQPQYQQPDQHYSGNAGVAYNQPQTPGYSSHNDYDWDSKSAKSYQSSYHGSMVHLNPNEVSHTPPVPAMPYQQQSYPPQRPAVHHAASTGGWSAAKEKLMRRRSVKQVQLFQGNLVLDVDVPTAIIPAGKQGAEEFSKLRYTAATCDPDQFMTSRYSLRQYLWGRQTELFIVMTMYNEDEVLFVKTMNSSVFFLPLSFDTCTDAGLDARP